MSVNKAILVGYVGKTPEIRYTSSGKTVANFSLATSESYKDKSGERQQKTEWHSIVAWEKLAEIIQQYVEKGALLYIEGKIQTREWEDDKSGEKRRKTEIVAHTMKMLGGKKDEKDKPSGAASAPAEREPGGDANEITDDDIPF